ncbi:MAG: hypothetical protein WCG83_02280 [Candidatus Peregrinibacteria bacterium]
MRRLLLASTVALLLTSCVSAPAVPLSSDAKDPSVPSSVSSERYPSSVSGIAASSGSSRNPLNGDAYLDRTFVSGKWGVELRYHSTVQIDECPPVPVSAHDSSEGIRFTMDYALESPCFALHVEPGNPRETLATIYIGRAKNKTDIQGFIENVFPSDCEMSSEESTDGGTTLIFLNSKNPPVDGPDQCSEALRWNHDSGIVYFSPLGSKNGGGYKWPSFKPLNLPGGRTEFGYDSLIMDSLRFPESHSQSRAATNDTPIQAPEGRNLPLKFAKPEEMNLNQFERSVTPSPCQPTYFQPSDVPDADSSRLTVNGKSVTVSHTTYDEFLGRSLAPYRFVEYLFEGQDGCRSSALHVLKDGKHVALYTHIIQPVNGSPGWSPQWESKLLKVHNVHLEKKMWLEQERLIDLETKSEKVLPLDPCYLYGNFLKDGSMQAQYMEPYANAPTIFCAVVADGTPLVKVYPIGFGGSSMASPRVDMAKRLFIATDIFHQFTGSGYGPLHTLMIVNLDNTDEWALQESFAPEDQSDPHACFFSDNNPEFDLSGFSFSRPIVRYRYHRNEKPCLDPWTWSEWKQLSPGQFIVHR